METVVFVLMLLVCFNFILKQTYYKKWLVAVMTVTAALFTGFMWPLAIEQSKTQIANWLANPALMLDTSVVLSIEVILQTAFCMLAAHMATSGPIKKRTLRLYRFLRWFPGILIFPVLFSLLVFFIFSFPGIPFPLISWTLAGVVMILVPTGAYLLRKLLPEKELRLEILFLTNVFTAIIGIVATVNGRTAVVGTGSVNAKSLVGVLLLMIAGLLVGMGLRYLKLRKHKLP